MHEMCRSEGGRRGSRGASPGEGGRAQNWALGRPLTLGLVNDPPPSRWSGHSEELFLRLIRSTRGSWRSSVGSAQPQLVPGSVQPAESK